MLTQHNLTTVASDLDPNAVAVMDVERTRPSLRNEPIMSQLSSFRSSVQGGQSQAQINPGALKVEKTQAPMLTLNANLRYNYDDAYLAYADPSQGKQKEKAQPGRNDN